MSERKVLNKYFPPDFDPSAIVRRKGVAKKQQTVRLMAPFSMRCNTCGEYIYKGKKFNARKETAEGETYYGILIFRFYIKCPTCSAEITFKTDPKNTDYVAENGVSRNFEPWREAPGGGEETEEERLDRLEQEQAADPMAALENKTVDSKREMDILDALQEVRTRNARLERADFDSVVDRINQRVGIEGVDLPEGAYAEDERRRQEAEEDEEEVRRVFGRIRGGISAPPPVSSIELDEALDPTENMPSPKAEDDGQRDQEASTSDIMPPPPIPRKTEPKQATVKRKLDEVEPDAVSLLSSSAKDFLQKSPANGPIPVKSLSGVILPSKKQKSNALASKLGIKKKV